MKNKIKFEIDSDVMSSQRKQVRPKSSRHHGLTEQLETKDMLLRLTDATNKVAEPDENPAPIKALRLPPTIKLS